MVLKLKQMLASHNISYFSFTDQLKILFDRNVRGYLDLDLVNLCWVCVEGENMSRSWQGGPQYQHTRVQRLAEVIIQLQVQLTLGSSKRVQNNLNENKNRFSIHNKQIVIFYDVVNGAVI